jgi:hypothetical protein
MKEIFRVYGMPKEIISDRDTKFTSIFWKYLFTHFETKLLFSTSYHPQIHGLTERVNQVLEDMLRMHVMHQPRSGRTTYHWYNLPTTMDIKSH